MPRRARVVKRDVPPDARYGSKTITRFINKLMIDGKKSIAETIVYIALERAENQLRRPAVDLDRNLVGCATDAAGLHFEDRRRVAHGLLEDIHGWPP